MRKLLRRIRIYLHPWHEPDGPVRGDRWATCRICGKQYDVQEQDDDRNRVSSW